MRIAISPLVPALAAFVGLWATLFVAVPAGAQDFPLNDDWAYTKSAVALYRGEGVHYWRQPSMPLWGQWLWAWPFAQFFGSSHATFRLSTLFLAVLGIASYYDLLCRGNDVSPAAAACAATALALNPLFFVLAGTYMSDIPALAFSLIALALYGRALRGGPPWALAAAAAAATLALITRQNTAAAPLAAGVLAWREPALRRRPAWVAAVLTPLVAGAATSIWFAARTDAVPLQPRFPTTQDASRLTFVAVHLLGLVVLPVLPLVRRGGRWWILGGLAFLGMLVGAAWAEACGALFPYGGLFPYIWNIITPWGVLEFRPNSLVPGDRPLLMTEETRLALTLAGCAAGAGLLSSTVDRSGSRTRPGLASLFTAFHAAILLASPTLFDRYLLVLMPGALASVARRAALSGRGRCAAGALLLVGSGILSLGLAHDWLAWNSARWELGRRALGRGIPASDIEGGLEWDSWYSPVEVSPDEAVAPRQGLVLPFNQRRFPHLTGRYALSFSELPGTATRDSEPYRQWLVPGNHSFYLVEHLVE